eukprot:9975-Heterococcus_DN1.PRE.1
MQQAGSELSNASKDTSLDASADKELDAADGNAEQSHELEDETAPEAPGSERSLVAEQEPLLAIDVGQGVTSGTGMGTAQQAVDLQEDAQELREQTAEESG